MNVKKYEAPTMREALDAVKREMGNNAVILHTKTKKRNGLLGLLGKEMVEITASHDINVVDRTPPKVTTGTLLKYYKKSMQPEEQKSQSGDEIRLLHSDLNEIKHLVSDLITRSKHSGAAGLSNELLEVYMMLIENEVTEELSKQIIHKVNEELAPDELRDKTEIQKRLVDTLVKMMASIEPISCIPGRSKKIALVGPTGVGKTTTIAKLAAHFSLKEKKDVALVTIDTYRIAAVEQLRTYADIINIPLEVVLTPIDLKRAVQKHMHRDIVFVDTAGRSQKNNMQMSELKSFIEALQPDETHLVLSTTSNTRHIVDVLDRFRSITVDKVIFTKLDEAVSLGLIFNVISRLNKSLSYVTLGQNVPDDIAVTDPRKLAESIINGGKA